MRLIPRSIVTRLELTSCRYVPALYDPSTSTLHIHPTAPLYLLTHTAKRLRANIAEEQRASAQLRGEAYKLKRNDLGDTFGTKKAKSQIKAEERNKVDVSAMQGVKSHLMDSIGVRETDAAEGERKSFSTALTTACRLNDR